MGIMKDKSGENKYKLYLKKNIPSYHSFEDLEFILSDFIILNQQFNVIIYGRILCYCYVLLVIYY